MLSIKSIGCSGQEVAYYARFGQEDYYVKGGEPPGVWWGTGSNEVGLAGTVDKQSFRNLLEGYSADGEKRLVQNAGLRERRAGFDLTWSLPKSASILWSQGNLDQRMQIEQAAERALGKVLGVVEEYCGVTRRGKRGTTLEPAGLVAAVFRHETARAVAGEIPDPNVHFHTVLLNLSVREDGTTGSLDGRALFRPQMKMALGALFRAELATELERLGLSTYRPNTASGRKATWFEVDGVSKSLQDEFSKRRQEITAWMGDRGLTGAKAAEKAAKATRRDKETWTREELRKAWLAVGQAHGFDMDELFNLARQPILSASDRQRLVEQTLDSLMASQSRFSELELVRRVAEAAPRTGMGIDDIRNSVRNVLCDRALVVPLAMVAGEPQFTTREMLAIEARLLAAVERTRDRIPNLATEACASSMLNRYETLRSEQERAVRHITLGRDGISCVNGMAGTGKTFLLQVAREVWQASGHDVIGTALAAKAAQSLEEGAGISSVHLHSLLRQIEQGKQKLSANAILVLDEAGMVGTRMMEQIVTLCEKAGAKLVLVGDHRQLQAVDAGAPFRVISERVGVVELREITRQRETWAREAVEDLAQGKAESALIEFQKRGLLTVADNREAAMRELVRDWCRQVTSPRDALIFAGTRYETTILNRLCQEARLHACEHVSDEININGNHFFVGDRVLITQNNSALLVRNGNMGTVIGLDAAKSHLQVDLDSGYRVTIDAAQFPHLALGYAVTTHKGQGQTVESAYILAGGTMTDRELSYVQASRARGKTRLYTDADSAGPELAELVKQMTTSRAKDMAHEHLIEAA